MYSSGTVIIYGTHGLCTIKELAEHSFGDKVNTYYVLQPMNDVHSLIYVPCDNETLVSRIRKTLSKDEVDGAIDRLVRGIDEWVPCEIKRKERVHSLPSLKSF